MTSSTPASQPSPMSILVLLPESISSATQRLAPVLHDKGLSSRASSPNVRSENGRLLSISSEDSDGIDPVAHGRRLSLAPGLGAGIHMTSNIGHVGSALGFSPPSTAIPGSTSPSKRTKPALPSSPANQDAESKAHHRSNSATRAGIALSGSDALLQSAALKIPRGSIAGPGGTGFTSLAAARRPAAAGDELVNVLRQAGLEVTAVRQSAHLPGILTSAAGSSTFSQMSTPSIASEPVQQVILCPLGETPSLPSLSLLLARGTTPSAVCFQQDLLERARKVEDDWLHSAVSTIHHVDQLCNAISENFEDARGSLPHPVIVAYVTHGTLSPSAVQACISAGAYGVLHPPFVSRTASTLRQLVAAGQEGLTSTVAGLSSPPTQPQSTSYEDETKVVLTPTALAMGAEHESEKVLSAFTHQRRRLSAQLSLSRVISPTSPIDGESETPHEREPLRTGTSTSSNAPTVATPGSLSHFPSLAHLYDPLGLQSFDASRRRSVDTGGIAIAFDRATKRMIPMEMPDSETMPNGGRRGSINVVAGDKEQEAADGSNTTEFAEVLGEMYQQTMTSIDVQMGEYQTMAAPIPKEDRARLVEALSSWDFRPHQLAPRDLFRVACLIFEAILHTEGLAELGIDTDQVNRFLFAVRAIYHAPNPYHNYVHAIDVLQATYLFLMAIGVAPPFSFLLELEPGKSLWKRPTEESQPPAGLGTRRARHILRPQDVLGVLIAAIGHDVGHPGLSNAFMKNAKVPLSVVYDDKSVLENMHCMLIVHLLRKHGFGFLLGPASPAEAKKLPARAEIDSRGFRRVLYSAILATDMALHFAWIQRLKDFAEVMQGEEEVDRESMFEEDRVMLCQALIKCADISNPTRPIDVSEHWSTVLLDEWTKQASLEEELALPVSVAAGVDARLQAKGQVGFIDLFTHPLFKTTADVIPELRAYAESCENNRSIWQTRLELLEADVEANEARTATLRTMVRPTAASRQDERFGTLFPLILPPTLISPLHSPETPTAASPPQSPGLHTRMPTSPAVQAMRVVYRDEVHDRSLLTRHVLALTGFDAANGARRMSTPDALLVQSRS